MMIVVDTNVVSELMRPSPSPGVVGWVRGHNGSELYTTSVTLAEIEYGIERLPDGHRKELFRSTAAEVFTAFDEAVLPFDRMAAMRYAGVVAKRELAGAPIDGFDAQIAAICLARHASLATRNVKDFTGTGVTVIDPWKVD